MNRDGSSGLYNYSLLASQDSFIDILGFETTVKTKKSENKTKKSHTKKTPKTDAANCWKQAGLDWG